MPKLLIWTEFSNSKAENSLYLIDEDFPKFDWGLIKGRYVRGPEETQEVIDLKEYLYYGKYQLKELPLPSIFNIENLKQEGVSFDDIITSGIYY